MTEPHEIERAGAGRDAGLFPVARRGWLAALLSVIMPGLGQLYNGQARKAFAFLAAHVLVSAGVLGWMIAVPQRPLNVLVPALLILGVWAVIVAEAGWTARAIGEAFQPKDYNRWYIYVGVYAVWSFFLQPLTRDLIATHLAEPYRVPGAAMAPTILPYDVLLATPPARVQHDVLVVHELPDDQPARVNRIVGLPGDTLEMRDGRLLRNAVALDEPYARRTDPTDQATESMRWQLDVLAPSVDPERYRPTRDRWGPLVVPAGHVFVLGDNRDDSEDSRHFGTIPVDRLRQFPRLVYWSVDPETRTIRWERLGLRLR
jgi:signal peptidase I